MFFLSQTGTDFKSTSLKLLEAVSNCKDNDRFDRRSGPDTTATPCADALKVCESALKPSPPPWCLAATKKLKPSSFSWGMECARV